MTVAQPSGSISASEDQASSDEGTHRADRTVVIVDDHELLRAGTRQILEDATGFTVVGEAEDGETAFEIVNQLEPDLVLVDIRLPTSNGIDLARRIVADHPSMTVLILSAYDDESYVRAALAAGVSGYLLKTTPSQDLLRAIRVACDGTNVLDPAVSARLVEGSAAGGTGSSTPPLTLRELDVVRMASRGLANKAIGHQLGISPRTVEGHLNHIFEKLGATSRTELVHYALTKGLLNRDDVESGAPPR
jgi:DNA-binding NarL/FixJ family response regulator